MSGHVIQYPRAYQRSASGLEPGTIPISPHSGAAFLLLAEKQTSQALPRLLLSPDNFRAGPRNSLLVSRIGTPYLIIPFFQ
jgi:hypothetical protein